MPRLDTDCETTEVMASQFGGPKAGAGTSGVGEVLDEGWTPPVSLGLKSVISNLNQLAPLFRTILRRTEVLEGRKPAHAPHRSPVIAREPIEGSGQRYSAPFVGIPALGDFTSYAATMLDNTVRNSVRNTCYQSLSILRICEKTRYW